MGALIRQRAEDETDAQRRDRLAVHGSRRRKARRVKGNEAEPGGIAVTDRILFRMGDLIEEWARALMSVGREKGLRIEFIHACDLIGWAVERRPLLLATLYASRPSAILCENILDNSEPRARYTPTHEDISEFYGFDDEVAWMLVRSLGPDEVRRRWYLGTLPAASRVLPRPPEQHDVAAAFSVPILDGNSRK